MKCNIEDDIRRMIHTVLEWEFGPLMKLWNMDQNCWELTYKCVNSMMRRIDFPLISASNLVFKGFLNDYLMIALN